MHEQPNSGRGEKPIAPDDLRFSADSAVSLSLFGKQVVRQKPGATQAWLARHRKEDLAADAELTLLYGMHIHADIDVR
ncbi:MAG TPA: hypothetical protein PK677_17495, partial [Acidiphilium sp.]|nr:hypothetical protein [Acidiphilium sp.]HQU25305.1 hypothetical protein [Acidiphilium sp.]